tara:strand:- start:659 stop:1372 length:714 start_codon:yes stop_codon:yes gene_type:complete
MARTVNFRGLARTADFRDINKNGVDDRDEGSESREGASTSKEGVDQTQRGLTYFEQMQNQIFGRSEDPSDSLGRDLKLGFAYNALGKGLDYQLTKGMGEFQSGLYKDNALFGADLELRNQRDARLDEFGYGMRAMDKQFELQDAYQNREFGRNIGYMQASGEQTRKNYRAQGVEDRLARITQGEQDRLGYAAQGDQQRRNIRTTAQEGRKTYDFEDRINARTEQRAEDRSNRLARGF